MSIHTERSYQKALQLGASAAASRERWTELMGHSKRELAEALCHLAALCTGSYDEAIDAGVRKDPCLERIREEFDALRAAGAI